MTELNRKNTLAWSVIFICLLLYLSPLISLLAATVPQTYSQVIGQIHTKVTNNKTDSHSSMVIVGDIFLGRDVERLQKENGANYPFLSIQETWNDHLVLANFEAAIPKKHIKTPNFGMQFSVSESALDSLALAGATHLSLANNHAFDYEVEGYENAVKELSLREFKTIGQPGDVASSSLIYETVGGKQLAILAIEAVSRLPEISDLLPLLNKASLSSDIQIVYIHWGEEYITTHNKSQERLAHALIDEGIDIIVGHHPHVVQDIEIYKQGLIFYSLGNFIFDQYFSDEVQVGLQLRITPEDDVISITLEPVSSINTPAQPHLLDSETTTKWLQKLAERSSPQLEEGIMTGVITMQLHHNSATMSRLL